MTIDETSKLEIEQLWRKFKICSFKDEALTEDFNNFENETIFPKGTLRSEVWDYFNRVYPDGIKHLLKL